MLIQQGVIALQWIQLIGIFYFLLKVLYLFLTPWYFSGSLGFVNLYYFNWVIWSAI
jgi:hypothetical protein